MDHAARPLARGVGLRWTKKGRGDGQDGKGVNACLVLAVMAARTDKARFAPVGVAHKPWRNGKAEEMLRGQAPDRTVFERAARHALRGAEGCSHRRAIIRALQQAGSGAPQSQAGKRIRKGLGEIGVVGSAPAALADAIRHATGKRIRDMPVTMEKVLA